MGKQQEPLRTVLVTLPRGPLVEVPSPRRRTPSGLVVVTRNGGAIEVDLVADVLLPRPLRRHTDFDARARAHECPVCFARRGAPCWWAVLMADRSWCTHAGRRALVTT